MRGLQIGGSGHAHDDQARSLPDLAWKALRENGVVPTPRSFELFYLYFTGIDPALVERLEPFIAGGQKFTDDCVAAIHREYVAPGSAPDAIDDYASEIADAAGGILEHLSCNQRALLRYGGVLDHWAGHLHGETSIGDLLKAVTALTAETIQASARNRALEEQLSASGARIARLRQDLTLIRQEATTDPLTGLANRKALDAKLRRAVKQAKTDGASAFSILLLDVDHFKQFNDTYGHNTGDQVLRLVARLLSDNVKESDTAARYGGEEFVVLLAGADIAAATTVAEQIRQRLAHQRLVKRGTGEPVGRVTTSIGVAQYNSGEMASSLIERADRALYAAKHGGRNLVSVASNRDLMAV